MRDEKKRGAKPKRSSLPFSLYPLAFILCSCATGGAYLVSPSLRAAVDPRVAVLPFDNQSVDVGAADIMRGLAAEGFEKRGYPYLPLSEVDGKLSGMGVSEGGQLPWLKPADIGKALGADLLCYGDVEDFTFQNLGFVVRKSVILRVKIVSASTGETLYEGLGSGKDLKVYFNKDEAKAAFVEQLAVKLLQNILKTPLRREAEAAAWKALDRLPRR
ncbi:MAG: GNA1162 family protein [Elusimicrobiota bacterium]